MAQRNIVLSGATAEMVEAAGIEPAADDAPDPQKPLQDKDSREDP